MWQVRVGSMMLFVSAFVNQMGLSVTHIALPILAHAMDASPFFIGLIGTSGGVAYAVMTRVFGSTADKFSRKKLLVVAEVVQAGSMLLCLVSDNPYGLLVARFVFATGSALFWPLSESYVADRSEPSRVGRTMMKFNVSWSVAAIVGPQLGGFLITWFVTKTPFFLALILFSCFSVVFLLPETDAPVHESSNLRPMKNGQQSGLPKARSKGFPLIYVFLFGFNVALLSGIFPAYATTLGVSADIIGFMFLLSGVTQTLMFFSADKLQSKLGARVILLVGSFFFFSSLTLISMSAFIIPLFFGGFALFGIAQGMTYSTALFLILKESGSRRKAAALFESTLGVGFTLGPLVGGVLYQIGGGYPYLVGALLSLSTAAFHLVSER